jgi:4-hydroxy-tetrahydrodipicolinate synthase
VPDDFFVLSGEDAQNLRMMELGAVGAISVTANVLPRMMADFCTAFLGGHLDEARQLDARLQPIHKILFIETSPTPTKWALYEMGRIDRGIRLPLIELSEQHRPELRRLLEEVGAL